MNDKNEKRRTYYQTHKEQCKAHQAKYNAKFTPEQLAEKRRQYNKKYRETHREQLLLAQKKRRRGRTIEQRIADNERQRAWRGKRTPAQIAKHKEQCRKWRKAHADYVQAYNHLYRQSLRPVKGTRRLSYWQWERLSEAEKMRLQGKNK